MIDITSLAVPDNFKQLYGSSPLLRNPQKSEDIRLHEEWRSPNVAVVRISGKFFLVDPSQYRHFAGRMFCCELRAAVAGDGSVFVWPVKLDDESAKQAADRATAGWARVVWNTGQKGYDVQDPAEQHEEPNWHYPGFAEVLDLALKDKILDSPEHTIVKRVLKTAGQQQS